MPMIRLSRDTRDMVQAQVLPGFTFACLATDREDGWFEVPVDDEVAMVVAAVRRPGESDHDVVSRLCCARQSEESKLLPLPSPALVPSRC